MLRQHKNVTARKSLTSSPKSYKNDGDKKEKGSLIEFHPNPQIDGLSPTVRRMLSGKKIVIPSGVSTRKKSVIIIAISLFKNHVPQRLLRPEEEIIVPKSAFKILRC